MPQNPAPQHTGALESLQAREIVLRETVGKLEAQRPILQNQLNASTNPAIKAGIENRIMQIDLDLAGAKVELESVRAQITSQGGQVDIPDAHVIVQTDPQRSFLDRIDDEALTAMSFMTLMAVLIPLSIGLARRMWRRAPLAAQPALAQDAITRLGRLEQAVDSIAIEIERVSEGQRFVTRVLTERPVQASATAQPLTTNDADGLGEAKPFLALGAGPIEPIRMAERQAVRQSITPH